MSKLFAIIVKNIADRLNSSNSWQSVFVVTIFKQLYTLMDFDIKELRCAYMKCDCNFERIGESCYERLILCLSMIEVRD